MPQQEFCQAKNTAINPQGIDKMSSVVDRMNMELGSEFLCSLRVMT